MFGDLIYGVFGVWVRNSWVIVVCVSVYEKRKKSNH